MKIRSSPFHAMLCLSYAGKLAAATFTWDGGGAGNNLGLANNWNPDGAPPNNGTADLVFTGGARTSPNAETDYELNTLVFSSTTAAFTLGGGRLTMSQDDVAPQIRNLTGSPNRINNAVSFVDSGSIRELSGGMVMGGLVDIAAGMTLTLEAGSTRLLTMSGVAGQGDVIKTGQGTVRFTGASLLSGRFEVQEGDAELSASFLSASAVDIGADATLRLLSANRIPTTPLSVNGTLDMGGFADTVGALTGTGTILPGNGGALTVSQTTDTTTSTAIRDGGFGNPGSFTKSGTGVLTLSRIATHLGATTVAGGTLRMGAANRLSVDSSLTVNSGATLDLNHFSNAAGSLAGAGTVSLGSGTLTAGGNGASTTFSGAMTGTGNLVKAGNGAMTIASALNHTGTTTVSGGELVITADNQLGLLPGALTPGKVVINAAALRVADTFVLSSRRGVTTNAGAVIAVDDGREVTYPGTIAGTGFTKRGGGTATLTGVNTYGGSLRIEEGTVSVNTNAGLGNTPGAANASNIRFDGGTLQITNGFSLPATRGITVDPGGGEIRTLLNTTTGAGTITGTGRLTVSGPGVFNPTGTNTNLGGFSMVGGTLSVNSDARLGIVPNTTNSTYLRFDGGSLATTATMTLAATRGIRLDGGTNLIDVAGGATLRYAGVITGPGNLAKRGEGILALSGAVNTFTGTTTVEAGTLSLTDDRQFGAVPASATPGSVTLNGGALSFPQAFQISPNRGIAIQKAVDFEVTALPSMRVIYNGPLTGNGSFRKTGGGAFSLGGNSTAFQGQIEVNAGYLIFTSNHAGGVSAVPTTVNTGGCLVVGSGVTSVSTNETLAISGDGPAAGEGALKRDSVANATIGGLISLNADALINGGTNAGFMALENSVNIGAHTLTLSGNDVRFSNPDGRLSGSGVVSVLGNASFSAPHPGFDGGIFVGAGAMLDVDHNGNLGTSAGGTIVSSGDLHIAAGKTISDEQLDLRFGGELFLEEGSSWLGSGEMNLTGNFNRISFADGSVLSGADLISGGENLMLVISATESPASLGRMLRMDGGSVGIDGSGTLILNGQVEDAENVTLTSLVALRPGAANRFPGLPVLGLQDNGSAFDLSGHIQELGGLTGQGTVNLNGATLTVGNAGNHVFSGNLTGAGGITKRGAGSQAVTRAVSYSGTTRVEAGSLRMDLPSLNDSSTVEIEGTAELVLNYPGQDSVAGFRIDGDPKAFGWWGAVGNTLANFTTLRIAGPGLLNVVDPLATGYERWIAGFYPLGADRADDADPDGDGIMNMIEFVIGSDPTASEPSAQSLAKLPTTRIDGNFIQFVYRRAQRADYLADSIRAESSQNLKNPWAPAVNGVGGVTISENPWPDEPGVTRVTVRIPKGTSPRFVRLYVLPNPS